MSEGRSGGIGLLGVVFIVFLVLKLAEVGAVATWSWWWVTSPLWGGFVLGVALVLLPFLVSAVIAAVAAPFLWLERRRKLKGMMDG